MTKRQTASIVKKIKMHQAALAKHRDALRDLVEEVEGIVDTSTDAIDNLQYAVDALSQYQ